MLGCTYICTIILQGIIIIAIHISLEEAPLAIQESCINIVAWEGVIW